MSAFQANDESSILSARTKYKYYKLKVSNLEAFCYDNEMTDQIDIHKAGGVIIKDRQFLVTRSKGKDIYIAPGGKLEAGETVVQALEREMREELQISIDTSDLELLGSFFAIAAGKENTKLQMDVYIINNFNGELIPSSEVEEMKWVNTQTEAIELGSIFKHDVMPLLKERGLID